MPVNPIPETHSVATPYLIVAAAAVATKAFYSTAFNAIDIVRLADPSGKVMHAELRIGPAPIMLADEFPGMGYR